MEGRKKLTPPDSERCQAQVPGHGPFVLGGRTGDPNNGWRVRCENKPVVIAIENAPAEDGLVGSMSLCAECKEKMVEQLGKDFAHFTPIGGKSKKGKKS